MIRLPRFAKRFSVRFLREIRDMIYNEILEDDMIAKLRSYCVYPTGEGRPEHGRAHSIMKPHLFGLQVARELVERFYAHYSNESSDEFYIRSLPFEAIPEYLSKDFFKIGVTPAHIILPRLMTALTIEKHAHNTGDKIPASTPRQSKVGQGPQNYLDTAQVAFKNGGRG